MRTDMMAILFMIFAVPASAEIFYCTFSDIVSVDAEGKIEPYPLKDQVLKFQAVADTASGKVQHPFFGNAAYTNILLLDRGSKVSGFKVIAFSNEGADPANGVKALRNAITFQISTWEDGPKKPFQVLEASNFGYGTCE